MSDSDSIIDDEEAQRHKSNDKVSQSDDELASETSENEAEPEMVSKNVHVHTTNSYATAAMTRLCCLRSCFTSQFMADRLLFNSFYSPL